MQKYIFFFAFVSLIASQCARGYSGKKQPKAIKGVLDLRGWDFEKDGPVKLDGEWEFYWQKLLTQKDFESESPPVKTGYIPVPGYWNSFEMNGKEIGAEGHATFRLRLITPEKNNKLGLKLGPISTAYELDVNGKTILAAGQVGKTREKMRPSYKPRVETLEKAQKENLVQIRISNYHHRGGGIGDSISLGRTSHLMAIKAQQARLAWFLFGSLLIMGFYHLGLFSLRRVDKSTLWFGIFCAFIAFRSITLGNYFLYWFFPGNIWWLVHKIEYFTAFTALPIFALFLYSIFPDEFFRKPLKIICSLGWIFAGIVALTPSFVYSKTQGYFNIFLILAGTYVLYVMILAIKHKREGSKTFFTGFIILFAIVIHDVLVAQRLIQGPQYGALGVFLFIFSQASLLSVRFSQAFRRVESLSTELDVKNKDLVRLDQIKDEFLANTSHELRTPLNGIIGIADSLIEGATGKLNQETNKNLGLIVSSGKRLASLINDILDFSKIRNRDLALNLKPVDLGSMVDVVLTVSQPLLKGKELVFKNDVPEDLPAVHCDENRLQQILHNLVGNAVKFTQKGEIVISAALTPQPPLPQGEGEEDGVSSSPLPVGEGSGVRVTVSDTGIGIPKEKQEAIFTSFEQADASTEREYGGTGLGLSISKQLVELHGGKIWVESQPGQGSQFNFTLPASSEKPVEQQSQVSTIQLQEAETAIIPVAADVKETETEGGEEAKVLVVDDEAVNRQVLTNLLGLQQYQIEEAADGPDALRLIEAEQPDIVLLDIMMPRMSGYEVCRKLRENAEMDQLPIIMLTAKNQAKDLEEGFKAGANDYMVKPFSRAELTARLGVHLKLAQLIKQQRFSTIGQMAGGIVHDLKNPIGVIKGYAELARDPDFDKEERDEFLTTIEQEADRLSDMAHGILDYMKGEVTLNKEDLPLKEYLNDVTKFLKPAFSEDDIELTLQVDYDGSIALDGDRFRRVIYNLANNAREVMEPGGSFSIKAFEDNKQICIEFRDTGGGIPAEIQKDLFKPFATFGKASGTGLGLAMVKQLVEVHEGEITFESVAGEGTTFIITLPLGG